MLVRANNTSLHFTIPFFVLPLHSSSFQFHLFHSLLLSSSFSYLFLHPQDYVKWQCRLCSGSLSAEMFPLLDVLLSVCDILHYLLKKLHSVVTQFVYIRLKCKHSFNSFFYFNYFRYYRFKQYSVFVFNFLNILYQLLVVQAIQQPIWEIKPDYLRQARYEMHYSCYLPTI